MKTVLEFGVRGGPLAEAVVLPTQKLGAEMAANLVRVLSGNQDTLSGRKAQWNVQKDLPRKSWQSSTHFVSLSVLDGVARGPASAKLWKKDN
jgi:hypothetical protein